jgi:hypothetical protein
MKPENNLIEKTTKKDFHEKIIPKLFMFALPIILLSPVIPAIIVFAPTKISNIFAAIVALYTAVILITLTISLFFSSKIITRLVGIPTNFVLILFGFISYKLQFYRLFLNAFSLGKPFMLTSEIIDETMHLLLPLTTIGIWITLLPLIVYSLRLFFKANKKKNITNGIEGKASVMSLIDTHMEINNNKVYHIVLDVESKTGQRFITEKDFIIPNHVIHTISLGNIVDVLIDNNNKQDVYIQTSYGLL